MKERIQVDERLAEDIKQYYSYAIPVDKLTEVYCFSNPQLDNHTCNASALLPGGERCNVCNHRPKKLCEYTCHIHFYCLAAYGWRLGIVDAAPREAIKKIIQSHSYSALLAEIDKRCKAPELRSGSCMPQAEGQVLLAQSATAAPEPTPAPELEPEIPAADLPDDLIDIASAAKLWPCTVANIYSKVRGGRLTAYKVKKRQYVSRADVEHRKANSKKRKVRVHTNDTEE